MARARPNQGDADGSDSVGFTLSDLQAALARNEFVFLYQPKVYLVSGEIIGAEALLRWRRSDGTLEVPGAFVPLAEATGFITEITIRMLETLARDLETICALNPKLVISTNISARDLETDKFVLALFALIDKGIINPANIEIEITESSVLGTDGEMLGYLGEIDRRGIKLAMDDFGTGYANYITLSRFPFSAIKLDVGVIRRMSASPKDEMIVRSSIQMAHYLGLDVVAEGIESEYTYSSVQRLGCSYAQGFWIGDPMPVDDFLRKVRFGRRWPNGLAGLVYMAMLDHIEWRKNLIDAILLMDQQRSPIPEADIKRLELGPSDSRLGRWYRDSSDQLESWACYRELGLAHHAAHAAAAACMDEALAGAPLGQLLNRLLELSKTSTVVMDKLQELEINLLKADAGILGAGMARASTG